MTNGRLYERAGIDVEDFYRSLFTSDEVLDPRWFRPLERFDIRYARTLWVYDNVAPGSSLLDLGCGAGMLALLARKGVRLTGVDVSPEATADAGRNGYAETVVAPVTDLPFDDGQFDYVVSLDVLGHVEAADKDAVIDEIRRVLRPGGTTLHGVECTDHEVKPTYDEMDDDELRRFVSVDGHVGLEEEQEHAARFERRFAHVDWRSRFGLTLSADEYLKQADQYGDRYEADWVAWLRTLEPEQRQVFDMAMGYVFERLSDLDVAEPRSGFYVLLRASDEPLGRFAGPHRDRRALLAEPRALSLASRCLDRDPSAAWDLGWRPPEHGIPKVRWMGESAAVSFPSEPPSGVAFDLLTHMPDLEEHALLVEVCVGETVLSTSVIGAPGWRHVAVDVPTTAAPGPDGRWTISLRASRTYRPADAKAGGDDHRLSIAVCNLEVR